MGDKDLQLDFIARIQLVLQVASDQGSTTHFLESVRVVESSKQAQRDGDRHEMGDVGHKVGLVQCSCSSTR